MTIYKNFKRFLIILLVLPFMFFNNIFGASTSFTSSNIESSVHYFSGNYVINGSPTGLQFYFLYDDDALYTYTTTVGSIVYDSEIDFNYEVSTVSYTETYSLTQLGCTDVLNVDTLYSVCSIDFTDPDSLVFGLYGLVTDVDLHIISDVDTIISDYTTLYGAMDMIQQYGDIQANLYEWDIYDITTDGEDISYISGGGKYLEEDTKNINVYIPPSIYHRSFLEVPEGSTLSNTATFDVYLETDTFPFFARVVSVPLELVSITDEISGNLVVDFKDAFARDGLDFDAIDLVNDNYYWSIYIPQSFTDTPFEYDEYLDSTSIYYYNSDLIYGAFYDQGFIYEKSLFSSIPVEPTPPTKAGYEFLGWYTADGVPYNFDRVITPDDLFGDVLYLYSKYKEADPIDYTVEDPTPNNIVDDILNPLHLNNQFGYILIYVGLLVFVVGLMSVIKLPIISIAIAWALLTAFFTFLGLLPIVVMIISYGILAIILTTYKGGI